MMSTPSFSAQLKDVQEAVLPLLVPSAATFTTPLLNNFASSHDPLMESDTLFTAKADLGTVHVELDATLRALARNAAAEEAAEEEVPGDSGIEFGSKDPTSDAKQMLELVRQARLRSKLRGLAGGGQADGEMPVRNHASTTRAARLRKEAFEKEMDREEKEALDEFKRKLREAVLQT
ncbi:hypothetical protein H072_8198 [Dactylellina haptotyla CBS 200.50]|uniref:Uncharacterized protein n=1 Tax=Dactylellina haptotyla (strain CBS 200.50) TaxID=1284197 RepID=S8AAB8_DACHA|nr:hypothetical protein H072_8198 [Dactylellina haptotyla CBS 200.50]